MGVRFRASDLRGSLARRRFFLALRLRKLGSVCGGLVSSLEIEKPFERASKYILADDWADWIPTLFEPKQFVTLTSREYVYAEALTHRYKYLVGRVNKMLYGTNWSRSGQGLSDVVGVEPQKRGVLHLHAVWDSEQVPYSEIHSIWNRISGYSWVEPINAITGVAHYVSKYSVKGGTVSTYLSARKRGSLYIPGGNND